MTVDTCEFNTQNTVSRLSTHYRRKALNCVGERNLALSLCFYMVAITRGIELGERGESLPCFYSLGGKYWLLGFLGEYLPLNF